MNMLLYMFWCYTGLLVGPISVDGCKKMKFKVTKDGQVLRGFVFESLKVRDEDQCKINCYMYDRCLSYNYISHGTTCELNESDHVMHPENVIPKVNALYTAAENSCTCSKDQVCRYNFNDNTHFCEDSSIKKSSNQTTSSSSSPQASAIINTFIGPASTSTLVSAIPSTLLGNSPSTTSDLTESLNISPTSVSVAMPGDTFSTSASKPSPSNFIESDLTSLGNGPTSVLAAMTRDINNEYTLALSPTRPSDSSATDLTSLNISPSAVLVATFGDSYNTFASAPRLYNSIVSDLTESLNISPPSVLATMTGDTNAPATPATPNSRCHLFFPSGQPAAIMFSPAGINEPINEITVSYWLKAKDSFSKEFEVVSYKTDNEPNAFTVIHYSDDIFVKMFNEKRSEDVNFHGRYVWKHFVITRSRLGEVSVYKEGKREDSFSMAERQVLPPGGKLVFGQNTQISQFVEMSGVNIWPITLDNSEIVDVYKKGCTYSAGTLLSWETIVGAISGVSGQCPTSCT